MGKRQEREIKSYPSYIVGQNRQERKKLAHTAIKLLSRDKSGLTLVSLHREPDNPYDQNAVAVYVNNPGKLPADDDRGIKVGYLPAKHSWVAEVLDEDREVFVEITSIRREGLLFPKFFVDLMLTPTKN